MQGMVWQALARQGGAWPGQAGHGLAGLGVAWRGQAGRGAARQCTARLGLAGQGAETSTNQETTMKKLKISHKQEKSISDIVREVGNGTRKKVNQLPDDDSRILAWASVCGAVVGAALHDTKGDYRVIELVTTVLAMTPVLAADQIQREEKNA